MRRGGLVPPLTLPLTGAILMPGEHQVTPRELLKALNASCIRKRVEIRHGERVLEVRRTGGRVDGVRTSSERIPARHVIIASGVWSPEISGLDPQIQVIPRKGQILSLSMPRPEFTRIVRWAHAYTVPRPQR